jgi:hypothetical protein
MQAERESPAIKSDISCCPPRPPIALPRVGGHGQDRGLTRRDGLGTRPTRVAIPHRVLDAAGEVLAGYHSCSLAIDGDDVARFVDMVWRGHALLGLLSGASSLNCLRVLPGQPWRTGRLIHHGTGASGQARGAFVLQAPKRRGKAGDAKSGSGLVLC